MKFALPIRQNHSHSLNRLNYLQFTFSSPYFDDAAHGVAPTNQEAQRFQTRHRSNQSVLAERPAASKAACSTDRSSCPVKTRNLRHLGPIGSGPEVTPHPPPIMAVMLIEQQWNTGLICAQGRRVEFCYRCRLLDNWIDLLRVRP